MIKEKDLAYYQSLDKRSREYKQFATAQDVKNHNVQPKGVGDILEKITTKTGIKKLVAKFTPEGEDCKCDERKEKLNDLMPFRYKARCLTEKEYNDWGEFMKVRTLQISHLQVKFVCKLFASVFNRQYYQPCAGCSPKKLIGMIEKLDTVYKTYE
jgi:hypothetical protein